MAKSLGIVGNITVGGVDYQAEASDVKLEMEKVGWVGIGMVPWEVQVPGGVKKLTGNIEYNWDDALETGGTYPPPMSDSLVNVVFNIDSAHTLSFQAALYDISIKKSNKGLTTVTATFDSSGAVTYA
jgi:hypothetical protein